MRAVVKKLDGFYSKPSTEKKKDKAPDTFEDYKRKKGLFDARGYVDAVNKLYASSKKQLSSYGINNREISNKGLQNSGYASYIDDLSKASFDKGLNAIKKTYSQNDAENTIGYLTYLDKYRDKEQKLQKSVITHLVKNDVVDLNTAIAYGISAGLSKEAAEAAGKSAYEVTKQKVFNSILEQTVRLGLDQEGAKMLAVKMGVSENDAQSFAQEIGELLKYYGNISEEFLEYLEERTH